MSGKLQSEQVSPQVDTDLPISAIRKMTVRELKQWQQRLVARGQARAREVRPTAAKPRLRVKAVSRSQPAEGLS